MFFLSPTLLVPRLAQLTPSLQAALQSPPFRNADNGG
jgi:hypothetical protein